MAITDVYFDPGEPEPFIAEYRREYEWRGRRHGLSPYVYTEVQITKGINSPYTISSNEGEFNSYPWKYDSAVVFVQLVEGFRPCDVARFTTYVHRGSAYSHRIQVLDGEPDAVRKLLCQWYMEAGVCDAGTTNERDHWRQSATKCMSFGILVRWLNSGDREFACENHSEKVLPAQVHSTSIP